jgi:photosystem II stability/assembly factor-like uncharacterized protein
MPTASKLALCCVTVAYFLCVPGCKRAEVDYNAEVSAQVAHPSQVSYSESNFSEADQHVWDVSTSVIKGAKFDYVYFLDGTHGWAGGQGTFYRTFNGGETWERVRIDIQPDVYVRGIFFKNPYVGWAGLQFDSHGMGLNKRGFKLMQTSDGGDTWAVQSEKDSAELTSIYFSEGASWLGGVQYESGVDKHIMLLRAKGHDENWEDVTAQLKSAVASNEGWTGGWVQDMVSDGPNKLTLLTKTGDLFGTEDGGQNWRMVVPGEHAFYLMEPCCVGVKENKLHWLAAGNFGTEGTYSTLRAEESKGSWHDYQVSRVYFRSVTRVSGDRFMACGSFLPKALRGQRPLSEAGVFYSEDGGQNWIVVYRNPKVKFINAITTAGSDDVWAVGEDGLILHFKH